MAIVSKHASEWARARKFRVVSVSESGNVMSIDYAPSAGRAAQIMRIAIGKGYGVTVGRRLATGGYVQADIDPA